MDNMLLVEKRLQLAKKRLEDLWSLRKITDSEVLAAGDKVDKLLNLYNRLRRQ